jgi:hypothetical protein
MTIKAKGTPPYTFYPRISPSSTTLLSQVLPAWTLHFRRVSKAIPPSFEACFSQDLNWGCLTLLCTGLSGFFIGLLSWGLTLENRNSLALWSKRASIG